MRRALAAALLLATMPASAQDFDKLQIRTETLAPGVAVLFGAGGNIGVSFGPDGTALVDDQFAPLTPKIAAAVKALGATPARFVLNTHWHFDHTGGNENFGKAGAVLIAHDNVRKRMAAEHVSAFLKRTFPPSPRAALPVVTFQDSVTLHLNGDTISFTHVHNAHTDGDALVKFAGANVLHMGDVFVRTGLPFIDRESGGGVQGLLAAVDTALTLSDAGTKIIPGHGEVARRADLVAYRQMIATVRDRVLVGIKAGRSLAAIQGEKPAREFDIIPDAFIRGDAFVAAVHASLTAPAKAHKHASARSK